MAQQVAGRRQIHPAVSPALQMQQAIVVAGMHRSGTSLLAKYFSRCGVDMGGNLLPANRDNPEGFFEDMSFVSLHESILKANHTSWTLDGGCDRPLVGDGFRKSAIDIVERQRGSALWGWKDPRTVLFLDFWAELLPNAVFIFVYREPAKVIRSLYQRGDTIACRLSINGIRVPRYLNATRLWTQYNAKILDFVSAFPERCILFNLEECLETNAVVSDVVSRKFKIEGMESKPIRSVFNERILSREAAFPPRLIQSWYSPCRRVLNALNDKRWRP